MCLSLFRCTFEASRDGLFLTLPGIIAIHLTTGVNQHVFLGKEA